MRTVKQRLKFIEDSLLELTELMQHVASCVDDSDHTYSDPYYRAARDLAYNVKKVLEAASTFDDEE